MLPQIQADPDDAFRPAFRSAIRPEQANSGLDQADLRRIFASVPPQEDRDVVVTDGCWHFALPTKATPRRTRGIFDLMGPV
jgi:hypothetical protein